MFRAFVALAVFGLLFSQTIVAAAEKEDQFPVQSRWTGTAQGKDAKGVAANRGGLTLTVTSHEGRNWAGTITTTSEGKRPAAKVEVEGTVNSTYRVTMKMTKILQGAPPEGLLDVQFTGDIEDGRQLELRADHGSGAYVELKLTREQAAKQ